MGPGKPTTDSGGKAALSVLVGLAGGKTSEVVDPRTAPEADEPLEPDVAAAAAEAEPDLVAEAEPDEAEPDLLPEAETALRLLLLDWRRSRGEPEAVKASGTRTRRVETRILAVSFSSSCQRSVYCGTEAPSVLWTLEERQREGEHEREDEEVKT